MLSVWLLIGMILIPRCFPSSRHSTLAYALFIDEVQTFRNMFSLSVLCLRAIESEVVKQEMTKSERVDLKLCFNFFHTFV